MRVSRSADRVDRDLGIAIRAVLEPDRAGKTGGKFPVHLAPQLTRSAMYCGVIISRYSTAVGSPISVISRIRLRAILRP